MTFKKKKNYKDLKKGANLSGFSLKIKEAVDWSKKVSLKVVVIARTTLV